MKRIVVPCVCNEEMKPYYASELAAGADLKASIDVHLSIGPGEFATIPTGLRLSIPEGYEGQVRPRSGLAFKHGVTVLNAPGTIDADYRGEVKVVLVNHGKRPFLVNRGDRIAQLIISEVVTADFERCAALAESNRGSGGVGSTGC